MDFFYYIDILFFTSCSITVLYLLIFAFFSLIERKDKFSHKFKNRFAIIIPTVDDNNNVIDTIDSAINQDYPLDCFDSYIVCNKLNEETKKRIEEINRNITILEFDKCPKTKLIKYAVQNINEANYDIAFIVDSGNTIEKDLLSKINISFSQDFNAIQCHRIHKERTTNVSIIDAVTDEINNSIFRRGHVSVGLSSSLCGTGMAFDFSWFANNIVKLNDHEDEKTLESHLMKDNIFIDYLNDAYIYSAKSDSKSNFYKQRSNWIQSHYLSFFKNIHNLPKALIKGNFDYVDRIIQWGIFPRSILITIIICFALFLSFINWTQSIKWWILLYIFLFTMACAIPDYLVDKKFNRAIQVLPLIGLGFISKIITRTK